MSYFWTYFFFNWTNIERMYYKGTREPTSIAVKTRATSYRVQGPRKTVALHHQNFGRSQLDPNRHWSLAEIVVRGLAYPYQPLIDGAYRDRPRSHAWILFGCVPLVNVIQLHMSQISVEVIWNIHWWWRNKFETTDDSLIKRFSQCFPEIIKLKEIESLFIPSFEHLNIDFISI